MRDSGIIASPASRLRRGLRPSRAAAAEHDARPPRSRAAPNSARASSVRPGADEAGEAEDLAGAQLEAHASTPGARSPRTESTTGASAAGGAFGGNVEVSGRPSIASTSDASVSAAVGAVCTILPVAQHGHRVGELEHLARGSAR